MKGFEALGAFEATHTVPLELKTENSSFIITFRISSEITMSLGVGL